MATFPRSIPCTDLIVRPRRAIRRSAVFALLCTASLYASGPGYARAYKAHDLGNWTVSASSDGKGCFLTRTYERPGGTTVLLGLNSDGTNRLSVLNANWSIESGAKMKLDFRLSNSSYPAHFAVGLVSEDKQGFVTSFGTDFPSYFAASSTLQIARGKTPVERLDLDGSSAAVAALKNCVVSQLDEPAAPPPQKANSGDIPRDPFAPAPRKGQKDPQR